MHKPTRSHTYTYVYTYHAVLVDATSAERDVNVEWYYADFSRRYKYLLATVDFPPIGPTDDNVVPLATLLEVSCTCIT